MWLKYILTETQLENILKDIKKKILNLEYYTTETQYYNIPDNYTTTLPGIRQAFFWEPSKHDLIHAPDYWFDKTIAKILIPSYKEVFLQKDEQFMQHAKVDDLGTIDALLRLCKATPNLSIKTAVISFPISHMTCFLTFLENTNQFFLEGEEISEAPVLQEFAKVHNLTTLENRSFFDIVSNHK